MDTNRNLSPVNLLFVTMLALVSCGVEPALTSAALDNLSAGPQYLSLPEHPDAPFEFEYEGHGLFMAPFGETHVPPPFQIPVSPGAPAPQATFVPQPPPTLTPTNVSNDTGFYEGETGAASNGVSIVAGANALAAAGCAGNICRARAYASSDGVNFTTTTLSATWNGNTFPITFDPSIDYDTVGNYYFALGGAPLTSSYPNSVAVAKAGPSGTGWGTPVTVTYNTKRFFDDKYYVAVDRSASTFRNRVYVGWTRNTNTNQMLYVAYSATGGTTWSSPIKVDDAGTGFQRVINAYPAVNHNTGTVYMSWHNYAQDIIFIDRSTNGGVSWQTDVAAAPTHTGFAVDLGCNGGRGQSPAHHLRVGPSGTLHMVYADNISGRGFDILYTRSTNGGTSWSMPVTLNDDSGAAHQYHPTLSVAAGGGGDVISVSFYDRREDPSNCLTHRYATRSTDGGLTWSANTRITAMASNFDGNVNGPGDYSSAADFSGQNYPFFSAHPPGAGAGEFDIHTAPF